MAPARLSVISNRSPGIAQFVTQLTHGTSEPPFEFRLSHLVIIPRIGLFQLFGHDV